MHHIYWSILHVKYLYHLSFDHILLKLPSTGSCDAHCCSVLWTVAFSELRSLNCTSIPGCYNSHFCVSTFFLHWIHLNYFYFCEAASFQGVSIELCIRILVCLSHGLCCSFRQYAFVCQAAPIQLSQWVSHGSNSIHCRNFRNGQSNNVSGSKSSSPLWQQNSVNNVYIQVFFLFTYTSYHYIQAWWYCFLA